MLALTATMCRRSSWFGPKSALISLLFVALARNSGRPIPLVDLFVAQAQLIV